MLGGQAGVGAPGQPPLLLPSGCLPLGRAESGAPQQAPRFALPVWQPGSGEIEAAPNLALLLKRFSNTAPDIWYFPCHLQLSPPLCCPPAPRPAVPILSGCGRHFPPFCRSSGSPSSPPGKQAHFSSWPTVQTLGFARSKWRRFPP